MNPRQRLTSILAVVVLTAGSTVRADNVCQPTLCNGTAPTFVTLTLPTVPVDREIVVPLEIRGNNRGTYFPFTDTGLRGDDARVIHVDLDIDSPTRRDAQRLVVVRFGKCFVVGVVHTCYVGLRGIAPGETTVGLKVFDKCVNDRCPGESSRAPLHLTYTTRPFALRVGE